MELPEVRDRFGFTDVNSAEQVLGLMLQLVQVRTDG
jgi:hypothetical protein